MVNIIPIIKRKIFNRFLNKGALSEKTAKSLAELNLKNRYSVIMNSLLKRDAILKTKDNKYYLNNEYYQTREKRISLIRIIFIPLMILVMIISILLILNIR
jgi:hypothetical protein